MTLKKIFLAAVLALAIAGTAEAGPFGRGRSASTCPGGVCGVTASAVQVAPTETTVIVSQKTTAATPAVQPTYAAATPVLLAAEPKRGLFGCRATTRTAGECETTTVRVTTKTGRKCR